MFMVSDCQKAVRDLIAFSVAVAVILFGQPVCATYVEAIPDNDGVPLQEFSVPEMGMQLLEETALSEIDGQAFIWADRIEPNSLTGAASLGGLADFTFIRMGLDAEVGLNSNIAKLQLGCGGVNENVRANSCDIDLDYASLMGRNGFGPGDPVTSEFVLTRPYIEIAVKNEHSLTQREVVGIKIGAAQVDGYLGVGRVYNTRYTSSNGQPNPYGCDSHGNNCSPPFIGTNNAHVGWNMEHNIPCQHNSLFDSDGFLSCHSGVNSLSGFVGAELSATLRIAATGVIPFVTMRGFGCGGATSGTGGGDPRDNDACGTGFNDRLFLDYGGTRLDELYLSSLALKANGGMFDILSAIGLGTAYAQLIANTRMLHGFTMVDTSDFFLSFQREQVAYPRYSKTTPTAADTPVCGKNNAPSRCSMAYAVPANTGWWMNIPDAKLMNVLTDEVEINGINRLLSALGAPGLEVSNPDLLINPPKNCYGSALFC